MALSERQRAALRLSGLNALTSAGTRPTSPRTTNLTGRALSPRQPTVGATRRLGAEGDTTATVEWATRANSARARGVDAARPGTADVSRAHVSERAGVHLLSPGSTPRGNRPPRGQPSPRVPSARATDWGSSPRAPASPSPRATDWGSSPRAPASPSPRPPSAPSPRASSSPRGLASPRRAAAHVAARALATPIAAVGELEFPTTIKSHKRTRDNCGVLLFESEIDAGLRFFGLTDSHERNRVAIYGTADEAEIAQRLGDGAQRLADGSRTSYAQPRAVAETPSSHGVSPALARGGGASVGVLAGHTLRNASQLSLSGLASSVGSGHGAPAPGPELSSGPASSASGAAPVAVPDELCGPLLRRYRVFFPATKPEQFREHLRLFALPAKTIKALLVSPDIRELADMASCDPVREAYEVLKDSPDASCITPERLRALLETVYPELRPITRADMAVLLRMTDCNRDDTIDLFDVRHMLSPEQRVVNAFDFVRSVVDSLPEAETPTPRRRKALGRKQSIA